MFRTSRFVFALVATLGVVARAEDPRFGVQVHGSIPSGDLNDAVDGKLGVGGGAHGSFDLGDGHMIRPRLDYTIFPEATVKAIKSKFNDLSLGADYLYFLSGKPEGAYVTAGLALHRWSVDRTAAGLSYSGTSNKPGFAAGAGYNFNASFGAEVRFLSTKYSAGGTDFTANAIQAGVTLRF
jgi:hypothetical protein